MIDFIKDADCTKETPVKLGVPDAPIYGKGIKLKPRVDGRTDSEHFKKIYLPELLPLEEYDLIVVLISGGKDSVACYLKLLELGVPKERIEFWHHDIDGGHPSRRMDWKCTQNYVKALADAEGIKLRVSYRVNGFFGELYRISSCRRPRDSRISLRLLMTAIANTYFLILFMVTRILYKLSVKKDLFIVSIL